MFQPARKSAGQSPTRQAIQFDVAARRSIKEGATTGREDLQTRLGHISPEFLKQSKASTDPLECGPNPTHMPYPHWGQTIWVRRSMKAKFKCRVAASPLKICPNCTETHFSQAIVLQTHIQKISHLQMERHILRKA